MLTRDDRLQLLRVVDQLDDQDGRFIVDLLYSGVLAEAALCESLRVIRRLKRRLRRRVRKAIPAPCPN